MEKLLSIIIPTYNMEKYLRKCLDSLIIDDEGMSILEVLVINDGSTDSSSQIAHEYQQKFSKTFRVIDKENGNYGSCINRGLKELTGKYVKVLDADDSFETKEFNQFVNFLKTTNAECILTDFVFVKPSGQIKNKICLDLPQGIHDLEELPEKTAMQIWMHEVTYLSNNLYEIQYNQTEGISYTDQEWIFLPLSVCKTWQYYPHVIYKYLVDRPGQTVNTEVWEKNFWMELQGMYVMHDEMDKYKNLVSNAGRKYLEFRLKIRTLTIYNAVYFNFKTDKNLEGLQQYDKMLSCQKPEIIRWLESIKILHCFRYVKKYRQNFKRSFVVKQYYWFRSKLYSLYCTLWKNYYL